MLGLAHEVPMVGHLGITKTKDRVLQRYYWPGVFSDIAKINIVVHVKFAREITIAGQGRLPWYLCH